MTDKKYEKACQAFANRYEHAPWLEVTIVMTPNEAREAMAIGGFDLDDFFQGRDAVCIRSNPQMRTDLAEAAAFGLHVLLDELRKCEVESGQAANTNERPTSNGDRKDSGGGQAQ